MKILSIGVLRKNIWTNLLTRTLLEYKYNQEITECEWKQIYNRSDKKLITPINGIHNSFSPNVIKDGLDERKNTSDEAEVSVLDKVAAGTSE